LDEPWIEIRRAHSSILVAARVTEYAAAVRPPIAAGCEAHGTRRGGVRVELVGRARVGRAAGTHQLIWPTDHQESGGQLSSTVISPLTRTIESWTTRRWTGS
jgi:hypothetical protein